jgi:hypothetical protein
MEHRSSSQKNGGVGGIKSRSKEKMKNQAPLTTLATADPPLFFQKELHTIPLLTRQLSTSRYLGAITG